MVEDAGLEHPMFNRFVRRFLRPAVCGMSSREYIVRVDQLLREAPNPAMV